MKPRRRIMTKIAALLLAGAALNVVVAWTRLGKSELEQRSLRDTKSPTRVAIVQQLRAGWPQLSMQGEVVFHASTRTSPWFIPATRIESRFALPTEGRSTELWGEHAGFLPLGPLLPGFAVNTVFYAGVLWMLFAGPFALRRMIRKRRGLCPACGYPTWGAAKAPYAPSAAPPALAR